MIAPADCIAKYGFDPGVNMDSGPFERKWMRLMVVPDDAHSLIASLPLKIYCNADFIVPFQKALKNIINGNLTGEIREWGGCFNIRLQRGASVWSIHSWGVAFDINPSTNRMGTPGNLSPGLVRCFTDAGFDWGGSWSGSRCDPMHFQLSAI